MNSKSQTRIACVCICFATCAFGQFIQMDPLLQQNLQQAQMRTAAILQEQQRAMSLIDNAGLNANGGQVLHPTVQSYQMQANQTIQQMRLANQLIDNPTPQNLKSAQFLANMAEVGRSNARVQGWQNALNQRQKALNEFYENTGRKFEYTDRPEEPGELQDEWDRCNRSLERFK